MRGDILFHHEYLSNEDDNRLIVSPMVGHDPIDETLRRIIAEIESGRGEELTMYESLAPVYDYLFASVYDYETNNEYVQSVAPDTDSFDYLCAGCGSGRLLEEFAEAAPDANATGIDLHGEMLAIARDRLQDTEGVMLERGNALTYEGEFDVVSAFNLIPHFDDETLIDFFEHTASLLRSGGGLVFDYKDPRNNPDGMFSTYEVESDEFITAARFITLHEPTQSHYAVSYEFQEKAEGESHSTGELIEMYFQTPAELERGLRQAGFSCIEVHRGVGNQSGIVTARQ